MQNKHLGKSRKWKSAHNGAGKKAKKERAVRAIAVAITPERSCKYYDDDTTDCQETKIGPTFEIYLYCVQSRSSAAYLFDLFPGDRIDGFASRPLFKETNRSEMALIRRLVGVKEWHWCGRNVNCQWTSAAQQRAVAINHRFFPRRTSKIAEIFSSAKVTILRQIFYFRGERNTAPAIYWSTECAFPATKRFVVFVTIEYFKCLGFYCLVASLLE